MSTPLIPQFDSFLPPVAGVNTAERRVGPEGVVVGRPHQGLPRGSWDSGSPPQAWNIWLFEKEKWTLQSC